MADVEMPVADVSAVKQEDMTSADYYFDSYAHVHRLFPLDAPGKDINLRHIGFFSFSPLRSPSTAHVSPNFMALYDT